jgi:geranylgeranyl diphosphate synthase type II
MNNLSSSAEVYARLLDEYMRNYLKQRWSDKGVSAADTLLQSAEYSLFTGGKRFRPLVGFLVAEALGCARERVLPWAAAVEMVHTYSLIHDDLPCMDDDDVRRGQPTNHRVYGEALALLAGDALLTEAFTLIGQEYCDVPEVGMQLVAELGQAAGLTGMIAGQVIDVQMLGGKHQGKISRENLEKMQSLKTGALILVAVRGAAIIARVSGPQLEALTEYGRQLGLAFQLADDLLDYDPQNAEASGYPALIGIEETQKLLQGAADRALTSLKQINQDAAGLRALVEMNLVRKS